jgi:hypothetical protein
MDNARFSPQIGYAYGMVSAPTRPERLVQKRITIHLLKMQTTLKLRRIGAFLSLMLLCSCAATHPRLPGEVTINKEAGRGGFLIVTVRTENGQELPCIVDTGSAASLLDLSLEPTLGKLVAELR